MRLSAVIVAAGSSTRAGADKLFAQIGGQPVVQYSIAAFESTPGVEEIVIVGRSSKIDQLRSIAANFAKVRTIVPGGERRQDSVRAGLDAVSPSAEFIAVHDAARPLIRPGDIERVFSTALQHGAAVLARPVTDTLKFVDGEQFVSGSIDRRNVFAMQTPQIFARDLLLRAYQRVAIDSLEITDEVSAVELIGSRVAIVSAQEENMKVTFARDLAMAELVLRSRHPERSRVLPRQKG